MEHRNKDAENQQSGPHRIRGKYGRMACDFCRKRKIRCDNLIPCSACIRSNRRHTCSLSQKDKDTQKGDYPNQSPSIHLTNTQNESLNDQRDAHRTSITNTNTSTSTSHSRHTVTFRNSEEARQARYHGPTSASFHDLHNENENFNSTSNEENSTTLSHTQTPNSTQQFGGQTIPQPFSTARHRQSTEIELPSDESLSPIITANAAHQQHAEITDIVSGRLDFDGIDPELTMHLLSLHWNRQHHAFLVTYRPLFMRDMAAGSSGRYFSKLLLHAILFGASKFSDRIHQMRANPNDPSSAGSVFKQKIDVLLPEALMTSRITTVQALLLLACTHFARGAESAAWLHSGLAFRMASDLGLFVSDYKYQVANGQMAPEELELRRRVAWAAYTIDKIHSLYQGRQVSIRFTDMGVPANFLDTFEENEYWTPIAYQSRSKVSMFGCTVFSVSTFTQLCKLTIILEQIIETLYGVKSGKNSKEYLLTELERLKRSLLDWFHSIPDHLRMNFRNTPPLNGHDLGTSLSTTSSQTNINNKAKSPNVISLNALYHCLIILLNRPFLPYGHLYDRVTDGNDAGQEDRTELSPIARTAWKVCVDAAWQISHLMYLYRNSVTMKGAPQLISYINFCAAGIHVRLAAQVGPQSDEVQRKTSQEALRAVRACLEDFEENEHSNPGVAKANNVIRRMAKHFSIYPDRIEEKDDDRVHSPPSLGMVSVSSQIRTPNKIRHHHSVHQDQTISTPSQSIFPHRFEGMTTSNNNLDIMNTDLFDLNAFLSTFDDLTQPESLSDTTNGSNAGADVMFGFLKYTQ